MPFLVCVNVTVSQLGTLMCVCLLVIRISPGLSGGPTLVFVCNDPHQNAITLCESDSGLTYGESIGHTNVCLLACN